MLTIIEQVKPDNKRLVKFGAYDWLVLDEADGKMLIVTKHVISYNCYHIVESDEEQITWEECDLRRYLNGEFIAQFRDEDRARIVLSRVEHKNNPWYAMGQGGNDTDDFVFLLSIDEMVKYFGDSGDLAKRKGWYWAGVEENKEDREYDIREMILKDARGQFLYDQYNDARIASNLDNGDSWWRLRSPGGENVYTAVVSPIGAIILTGTPHHENGTRPAMWVKI